MKHFVAHSSAPDRWYSFRADEPELAARAFLAKYPDTPPGRIVVETRGWTDYGRRFRFDTKEFRTESASTAAADAKRPRIAPTPFMHYANKGSRWGIMIGSPLACFAALATDPNHPQIAMVASVVGGLVSGVVGGIIGFCVGVLDPSRRTPSAPTASVPSPTSLQVRDEMDSIYPRDSAPTEEDPKTASRPTLANPPADSAPPSPAVSCPKCGNQTTTPTTKRPSSWIGIVLGFPIFAFFVYHGIAGVFIGVVCVLLLIAIIGALFTKTTLTCTGCGHSWPSKAST